MNAVSPMTAGHWPRVREIFREGVLTGNATFETVVPDWETWDRIHLPECRLVLLDEHGNVAGWAALQQVSRRACYAGVAEVSIYLGSVARGHGLGKMLLKALIDASEANGYWTLQAAMFPENIASVHLHRQSGFREVGYRHRVGKLHGAWRDVLLMERRSEKVGV
jgi:L-amino acid N-acyltransferase YncA